MLLDASAVLAARVPEELAFSRLQVRLSALGVYGIRKIKFRPPVSGRCALEGI